MAARFQVGKTGPGRAGIRSAPGPHLDRYDCAARLEKPPSLPGKGLPLPAAGSQ